MTDNPTPPDNDIDELLAALDAAGNSPKTEMGEAPKLERADLSVFMRSRESDQTPPPLNEKPAQPKGLFTEVPVTEEAESEPPLAEVLPAAVEESPLAETPEEPPPIIYHYRLSLVLPTPLEMLLNNLRQSINLPAAAVGTFTLQADFECEDAEQLKIIVQKWVHKNLPLKLTADRVEAAVVGEQRYVAGWGLEPAEKFQKSHKTLTDALAPHIKSIAQDPLPFESRLVVSDHTPAEQFPRLIHTLQTRFQEHEWAIQGMEILRAEAGDERWEVFEKFSRE